jgi:CPA2 family monovalent cation:H+ antiporter-2
VVCGLALGALAHRLGQPVLLGYIAAGILLGPHTGGLSVSAPQEIELLAEIGVALLLFAIGIEFSLSALRAVRRIAIVGTVLQLLLTMALGAVLGRALGWSPTAAVWFGALISVSSTMVAGCWPAAVSWARSPAA